MTSDMMMNTLIERIVQTKEKVRQLTADNARLRDIIQRLYDYGPPSNVIGDPEQRDWYIVALEDAKAALQDVEICSE